MIAVPAYYVAYGFLAQVPGANPSQSSGSRSCAANGVCQGSATGDAAKWFIHTTELVGILSLIAAAVVDVVALWFLIVRSRKGPTASALPGVGKPSETST
jgi:hypothetical protein